MIKSVSTKIFLIALLSMLLQTELPAQRNFQYREKERNDDQRLEQRSNGYRNRAHGFNHNRKNMEMRGRFQNRFRGGGFCAPGIRKFAYRRGLRDGINLRRGNGFRSEGPQFRARKFYRSRSL